MNDTYITFQGWMGGDPVEREAGEASFAQFRVASTPRRFNRRENTWVDGETTWYTVNAWRTLGQHCLDSLRHGEAVVVHGKLRTEIWEDDDRRVQSCVVEAISVGHDLNRGTATFTKRVASGGEVNQDAVREANAALGIGGPQISSDGRAIDDLVARPSEQEEPAA